MASRSAIAASFGNELPNVTPGSAVAISPVALRLPIGAVILGSNVSIWLGPPCRKRKTTDFPVSGNDFSLAFSRCEKLGKAALPSSPPPSRSTSRRPYRRSD